MAENPFDVGGGEPVGVDQEGAGFGEGGGGEVGVASGVGDLKQHPAVVEGRARVSRDGKRLVETPYGRTMRLSAFNVARRARGLSPVMGGVEYPVRARG